MGIRGMIKQQLSAFWEKRYQTRLAAKKITYKQWITRAEDSAAFSACQDQSAEDSQVALIRVGEGEMAAGACAKLKAFFDAHPRMLIAYGDEDVWENEGADRSDPWYKPDWSPDTFQSGFYWGSLVAVRGSWLQENGGLPRTKSGKELMDALAQLAVKAGGFEKGCDTIGHLPDVLFHGADKAQQEAYARWKMQGIQREEEIGKHLISVIIPSKDHPDILLQGLQALFETKGDCSCQVIVVDNGSCEENRGRIAHFLESAPVPCKYIYRPMDFNFSAMCNLGAEEADGELLLFLNDDVEAVCEGWLSRMAGKALLPYVGAVGLKLYYPGGKKIQHAGIVNLEKEPVHKLQFMEDDRAYYYGYNIKDRNVLAVTGACLMVTREKFRLAGGMKESLKVAYNDVELCFRLWELGYHNVVINSAYGYHHESLSRGADMCGQQLARLDGERELLYALHPALKGKDPYYSLKLNREPWDSAIRPAYITAANRIQEASLKTVMVDLSGYRRDDCLLISLEKCDSAGILGYSVVLGDDNACYRRELLLWKCGEEKEPEGSVRCLAVALSEQYRPDLEENMADQRNIALSGFAVAFSQKIPAGEYRVGITARSRVNGTGLINWSHRLLKTDPEKGWK